MKITETLPPVTSHVPPHQAENNISPMDMAILELQEASGGALTETLEDMGMVLGGRLRDEQNVVLRDRQALRQHALLKMIQRMQQQEGGIPAAWVEDGTGQHLGQQILSVTTLLAACMADHNKRKTLSARLAALMEEEGWEAALFGMLELGTVDKSAFVPLMRLFRQAMDEETVSLSEWFRRMMDWPDRRQRVRVLLRMMAFELSACVVGAQQQRLATVLVRLRRLLLFFGLEKECLREEVLCQLPANSLLPLLIDIITECWVFDEWLSARLTPLVSSPALFNRLLQHLDALFSLLPDNCFNDEDQREQIVTVLRGLKGNQVMA